MADRIRVTKRHRASGRNRMIKAMIVIGMLGIMSIAGILLAKKYMPSNTMLDLNEYYQVDSDKIMLIMQNNPYEEQGLYIDGKVYIDGKELQEDYLQPGVVTDVVGVGFSDFVVPENCVFAMGDNRNRSRDSRSPDIGQIDQREILGKAIYLFLPGTDEGHMGPDYERMGAIK